MGQKARNESSLLSSASVQSLRYTLTRLARFLTPPTPPHILDLPIKPQSPSINRGATTPGVSGVIVPLSCVAFPSEHLSASARIVLLVSIGFCVFSGSSFSMSLACFPIYLRARIFLICLRNFLRSACDTTFGPLLALFYTTTLATILISRLSLARRPCLSGPAARPLYTTTLCVSVYKFLEYRKGRRMGRTDYIVVDSLGPRHHGPRLERERKWAVLLDRQTDRQQIQAAAKERKT